MIKLQFIKNYFNPLDPKDFRKYNIIEGIYSKYFDAYLHYTEYHLYIIPKEYLKVYKH